MAGRVQARLAREKFVAFERVRTMRRNNAGKCSATKTGAHMWAVVTTTEQASQGLSHFLCRRCLKESMEARR